MLIFHYSSKVMVYIGQMTLQDEDAYSGIRLNEVLVLNAFLPALSQGRLRSRIRYASSNQAVWLPTCLTGCLYWS